MIKRSGYRGTVPEMPSGSTVSRRLALAGLVTLAALGPSRAEDEEPLEPEFVALGPPKPDLVPADFSVPNLRGGTLQLSAVEGPVLLAHFFATWCAQCRRTLQQLHSLKRALGPEIGIVALSVGEPAVRVERYLGTFDPGFAIGIDRSGQIARGWGVRQIPTHVVLDRALRPRLYAQGIVDWQSAETRAALMAVRMMANDTSR